MRKLIIIFLIISYPVYLGFDFMVWNEKVMKACDSVVGLNFFELSGRMKHEGFKVPLSQTSCRLLAQPPTRG